MGRIILPSRFRKHSIYLFVSDHCKPCMDMVKHLLQMRDGILDVIEVQDLSRWAVNPEASKKAQQLAYDHFITRVPTLIVVNHVEGLEEERIKGDKNIVQNIHRLLEKYWEKDV